MRAGAVISSRGAWPATTASYRVGSVTLHVGVPSVAASLATGFFWFPGLEKHDNGVLSTNVSLNADDSTLSSYTQRVFLSPSFAGTFSTSSDIDGFHGAGGEPLLPLPDGRVAGGEYNLIPVPNDGSPASTFKCDRVTYSPTGSHSVEANAVTITGFPSTVKPFINPIVKARISWFGDIVDLDGAWVSCLECVYNSDAAFHFTSLCIRSTDSGYNWAVIGEIGGPGDVASSEAFSECCIDRVPDGRLMAVSRTGTTGGDALYRAYSSDGGVTWTAPDALSHPGRKSPQLKVLANGVVCLAAGLNGLNFQFSLDSGATWSSSWDLMTHHNLTQSTVSDLVNSGYLAMQEVQSNRLAVVYDRYPTGRPAQPNDGSLGPNRVYLVDMLVNRA